MSEPHIAFSNAGRTTDRGVLFTTNSRPLTLLGTAIDVESHWTHARVKVRQEYRSDHPISVSAFAAFNNDDPNWQVLSFRCEVGQHTAYTKVVPKPAGEASYVSQRSEQCPDMFTAAIPFSIHAGQSALCTIIYFCPLKFTGSEKVTFTLPKGLVTGATEVEGSQWKDSFTVPHETRLGAGRTIFNAEGYLFSSAEGAPVVAGANEDGGAYPAANSSKKADPRKFNVSLEDRSPSLELPADINFDVALIVEEDPVSVQVTRDNGEHIADEDRYALAVALDPQFPAGSKPNVEVVVMLDDSLSMTAHTSQVKASLKALVSGLPPSCFLNIVKFGSSCSWLYPEGAIPVSDESVAEFKNFVEKWNPQDKKTKIYQAVREVYSQATIEGFARVVVMITDGSDGQHSGGILEVVDANKHTTRVVSIGLGETVDATLLAKMAELSGGFTGVVAGAAGAGLNDLCGTMCDAVGQTLVPTVCHVDLSYVYDGNDEAPPVRKCFSTLPLVPQGTKAFIYGLGSEELRGCTCLVTGSSGPNHIEYKVHTGEIMSNADKVSSNAGDAATASIAHQAAALARIRALVDYNPSCTLKSTDSKEVQRLGTTFSMPTPLTTLQGHDGNGSSAQIDPKCRMTFYKYAYLRQLFVLGLPPVTLDSSGAAVNADSKTAKATAAAAKQTAASAGGRGAAAAQGGVTTAAKNVAVEVLDSIVGSICSSVSAPAVLQSQTVNGWFSTESPAVTSLLDRPVQDILDRKPEEVSERTWITALVNAKMGKEFSYKQTRLASGKAMAYLAGQQDYAAAEAALASFDV